MNEVANILKHFFYSNIFLNPEKIPDRDKFYPNDINPITDPVTKEEIGSPEYLAKGKQREFFEKGIPKKIGQKK